MPIVNHASAQPNPEPGKCWGVPTSFWGYCERPAHPGKLTCWIHQHGERKAQQLKAERDAPSEEEE